MRTARAERIAFLLLAAGVIAAMALALAPDLAHATTHALRRWKVSDTRGMATVVRHVVGVLQGRTT